MSISVAICSHNPRPDYLSRTLEGLRAQTLPKEQWELLFVDNASDPPVAVDLHWHPQGRTIREEKAGLTPARTCAIRASRNNLILFVDDDNVLASDYLEVCLRIAEEWPELGTWGGQTMGEFETPPPEWTRKYWLWIAVREFQKDLWSNVPGEASSLPYGAGMCVRRHVAEAYLKTLEKHPVRQGLDRTGRGLLGGGDADLSFTACDMQLGNGIFAALKLTHLISSRRLTEEYLLNLVESMTYSHTMLFHFRGTTALRPSRSQRLLKWYQCLHISERERRFENAKQRGREAAFRDIDRAHQQLP
ncbi:MAG TPA: glycosyltransferase, partial [Chthoniobacteraceae bacterium]|nr:glycosyltransferase [Chthoniobacteraceae bacterium]